MTIDSWLKEASILLADAMIPSARLDAEIILAHTINHPRIWLRAHGDEELDPRRKDIADARVELRLERTPIAYIIGHKEFYGRRFAVSPDVLIPRPESEILIEMLKKHLPQNAKRLVDVGTGSGCLGITAKLELPSLAVTLLDISADALRIAKRNAEQLQANVQFIESDLLDQFPVQVDVIIANLPYLNREWSDLSPELASEPDIALYADENGLSYIKRLIKNTSNRLARNGLLLLEADIRSHEEVRALASEHGLKLLEVDGYGLAFSI
jgi:release factor glutamine methyltransferase